MNTQQVIEQGFKDLDKKAQATREALSYISQAVQEGYMSVEEGKRLEGLSWWDMVAEVKELGARGDYEAQI